MATPTIDTITPYTTGPAGSGAPSWSHTVAADADYLLVHLAFAFNAANAPPSVACGAVQMILLGTLGAADDYFKTQVWGLANPPTGAQAIAPAVPNAVRMAATSVSIKGVSSVGALVTATGTSAAPSVTVPGAAGDLVVDLLAAQWGDSTTAAVGAGQTQCANHLGIPGGTDRSRRMGCSTEEAGGASTDMTWGLSASQPWQMAGIALVGGTPNVAPVAGFTAEIAGRTVTATSTASDADGGITSTSYAWGDGNISAGPSHTYAQGGAYTITQTVTDSGGATATATQNVVTQSVFGFRRRRKADGATSPAVMVAVNDA